LTRIRLTTILLLSTLLFTIPARAQFPPAPGTGAGLPETIEAIDSARVTTRILYITAHPDDESAAVLTYLARGLHADVALLSLTRGEGGQNALGPEQAPQLGLIRTQELLAATRGYGVKLYFTRARDFGFSKTPEETQKIWGDQVLEDMVRVIRAFRPNIVINHWGGVHSGHGHHQASGVLTPKAVQLAADRNFFPELLKEDLPPWNGGLDPVVVLDMDRGGSSSKGYTLPLDEVSPLYGKSYRQLGIDAFVNHRTQGISGFINSPFLLRPISLFREDGKPLDPAILAEPLTQLFGETSGPNCKPHPDWCEKLKAVDADLVQARTAALKLDYSSATNRIVEAQKILGGLLPPDAMSAIGPLGYLGERNAWLQVDRVVKALLLAAGFEFRADAERSEIVVGEPLSVTLTYQCRPNLTCPITGLPEVWAGSNQLKSTGGDPAKGIRFSGIADSRQSHNSIYEELQPEPPAIVEAVLKDSVAPLRAYPIIIPVTHIEATSTSVVRVPLRLVPAFTLVVDPKRAVDILEQPQKPFDVLLRIHSYSTKSSKVSVGLDVPDGFKSTSPLDLNFDGISDQYAKLTVTPPANLASGNFTITAYAERDHEKFSTSLEPLPTMPTLLWSEPAQTILLAFDITVPANLHVGYISAEGELIPDALKRLGINVVMLDPTALTFGDLSQFTAIVVGVRAYELRPELSSANKRLLDYVSDGGTLVVQYNRDFAWDNKNYAPYSAKIGNPTPRITDENAPVKFLLPNDPLLNYPNKITQADFQNWVQERGLYYWSDFDPRYIAPLAMNDPSEKDLNGGLVYAHVGKGTYIYTGLAFFRELPEGVPGAYRLFVNLLSASKNKP
jgi:LmbE family N-acetylglucosaminyl deacetylase